MISRRGVVLGGVALVSGCQQTYPGENLTHIQVFKSRRLMQFMDSELLIKNYDIELGFAPEGHKQFRGDGKTPEGIYRINRKNPDSRFHLSLGVSYPNVEDWKYARSKGRHPGGDIFIHGTPDFYAGEKDWTWGCIAVTNQEMDEIYPMVRQGLPIVVYP
jgi:murein L,D-transpeptidase YafK